jgi:pimeloyl-ACP methyl ester carboxylesterase
VPTRFVHGAASPMPATASTDTAKLVGAPVDVVPDAGHFLWLEAPGAIRRNLDSLP